MFTEKEKAYLQKVVERGVDVSLETMASAINRKRDKGSQVTVVDVASYVEELSSLDALGSAESTEISQAAPTEATIVERSRTAMGLERTRLESEKYFDSLTRIVSEVLERLAPKRRSAIRITAPVPKDYCVVSSKGQAGLAVEVKKLMQQGWQPFGGVGAAAFGISPVGGNQYIQAMVKYY